MQVSALDINKKEVKMETLLTIPEVMERLKVGRTFTYRLLLSGELRSVKVGRARRIPSTALDDYISTLTG